ncbi:FAD-binding oxidoreductase [Fodinicurvata sp. EGI_FJ10296]|uniref:NAD(P)/FAD-dependent oxidoreductase n=1 Tax=Fodinicurvata sp. EGI_FJ10296 TaxID=3231908 RepID=UPI00345312B8
MQATMPERVEYLVVGAGIQGLAIAGAIAERLEMSGRGSGDGVLVVDKAGPGTGASWSASGSIHRFDASPVLFPIIDRSLDFLASDPVTYGFQQVGAIRETAEGPTAADTHPEIQHLSPAAIGRLIDDTWPDLTIADGAALYHDPAGGYVGARQMIAGLTEAARRWGVRIHAGTEVTRYETGGIDGCIVSTTRGQTQAGHIIIAVGPHAPEHWSMLGEMQNLPPIAGDQAAPGTGPSGWLAQPCLEGDVETTVGWRGADRRNAPLLILNTETITGDKVSISLRHGGERLDGQGLHVRLMPWAPIDPGGSTSWFQAVAPDAIGRRMTRFADGATFVDRPCTGGMALSPDRFPVADYVGPSVYWLADTGLGARGVGLAQFAADHVVTGARDPALAPFAIDRFRRGCPLPTADAPLPGL